MTSHHEEATEVPREVGPTHRALGRSRKEDLRGRLVDPIPLAVPAAARPFQGRPAGVVSRLLANTIDLFVTFVVVGLGYLVVSGVLLLWKSTAFSFPGFGRTAIVASCVAVLWAYLTLSWSTTGRTYGDHVVGLLVLDRSSERMGVVMAAARAAFCLAFPIGLLWCAVSPRSVSVQDVVLGTRVVYAWEGSRLRREGPRRNRSLRPSPASRRGEQ